MARAPPPAPQQFFPPGFSASAGGSPVYMEYLANTTAVAGLAYYVLFEKDDGSFTNVAGSTSSITGSWTRTTVEPSTLPPAGVVNIVNAGIYMTRGATVMVRGHVHARLLWGGQELCAGYLSDTEPSLSLGQREPVVLADTVAQMNATWTQANAAGGAVKIEVQPGAGSSFEVLSSKSLNSGTNTIEHAIETALNGTLVATYVAIGSAAGVVGSLPQSTTNSSSSSRLVASLRPPLVAGTQAWEIFQGAAGAQNDTLQILMLIRVKGALPTVSKANSTNQADVSVTAGAASFAFIS